MITPGLWRRSLRAGSQWRLLVLWLMGLALPAIAALLPLAQLLDRALSWSPRAPQLLRALDGDALVDLGHALAQAGPAAFLPSLRTAGLLTLLTSPLLAGAAVAAARADGPLSWRELLRGAGENYSRMLRLLLVAALPLAVVGLVSAGGFGGAHRAALKAVTEGGAAAATRAALALAAVLVFLAHVTLDLARGVIAAQPERRSAFFAWWHAVRVLLRRPLNVLGLALVATALPAGLALLFLLVRLKLPQGSAGGVLFALLFAQLALVAIGWGRAARIIGFAELVRADEAARARLAAAPITASAATVQATALPPAEPEHDAEVDPQLPV